MNVVERVDGFQRSHPVIGFPLAVFYKFNDDQGAYLSAIVTYYAFLSIFPLLLIATSVLGFVLQDNLSLQHKLLDTVLAQFPIIGDQLGRPDALTGSTTAIVVGSLAAGYGAMGLGQAIQNAANVAWAVPRNSRPNPILMRLRSLVLIAMAGTGVLVVAIGISILEDPSAVGLDLQVPYLGTMIRIVGLGIWTAIFAAVYRMLSLGRAGWRSVLPGAAFASFGWQLLQYIGDSYVRHVIARASAMNQTFALVLGLIGFLFIGATMLVLGLEVNVVLRRRLYPRALLTPFTDNVRLGAGDLRAYTSYARMQRHKGFQTITVEFDGQATAPPEPTPTPPEEEGSDRDR